jgi:benzodiazapine receptor
MATKPKEWAGLAGWLVVTFIAAGIGAIASANAQAFYAELTRPTWAPPSGVFGPVWTLLYLLMGIAAWLVWRERQQQAVWPALTLYLLQLIANALWTWLFFGWHRGALAFAEVVVLWLLLAATLIAFWRISRAAGLLLVPYLAWVSFATLLTWHIWQANPHLL